METCRTKSGPLPTHDSAAPRGVPAHDAGAAPRVAGSERESRRHSGRRDNAIYLLFLASACLIGAVASWVTDRPDASQTPIDLAMPAPPDLELEAPFDFPYPQIEFKSRRAPRLAFSDNVEAVLVEVRSALLSSAAPVAVGRTEELAATVE